MPIAQNSTDLRPYTYSRRWRTKYNAGRQYMMIGYRRAVDETLELVLGSKQSNFHYDEYLADYYGANGNGPYPFREITTILITPEIGNGEDDFILDKVIVDMQYDSERYGFYTYDVAAPDPEVIVDIRSPTYHNQTPIKRIDLIALNQTVMPSINPFVSVRQTPGDIDISSDEVAAYRESLALVSPMARYRRLRIEIFSDQKVTTIRALQVVSSQFPRRTYG